MYGRKIGEKLAICPLFAHFYFKSGQAETLAPQGVLLLVVKLDAPVGCVYPGRSAKMSPRKKEVHHHGIS